MICPDCGNDMLKCPNCGGRLEQTEYELGRTDQCTICLFRRTHNFSIGETDLEGLIKNG